MDESLKTGLSTLLNNLQQRNAGELTERDLQNINALLIDRKIIESLVHNLRVNKQLRELLASITSYLCSHKQPISTTLKCIVILSHWAQYSSILRELINEDVHKCAGVSTVDFIAQRIKEPLEDSALIKVTKTLATIALWALYCYAVVACGTLDNDFM